MRGTPATLLFLLPGTVLMWLDIAKCQPRTGAAPVVFALHVMQPSTTCLLQLPSLQRSASDGTIQVSTAIGELQQSRVPTSAAHRYAERASQPQAQQSAHQHSIHL